MSIRLGDDAPNFTAETTDGTVDFYDWKGDSWAVLFSHPKDFTPVCTTELGRVAALKPEFDRRNVKVIGLSVDPLDSHNAWKQDIADVTGSELNFPLIDDSDKQGRRPVRPDPPQRQRHHHRALGVRGRRRQQGEAHAHLPGVDGPQLRRAAPGHRLPAAHGQPQGRHPGRLEARAKT